MSDVWRGDQARNARETVGIDGERPADVAVRKLVDSVLRAARDASVDHLLMSRHTTPNPKDDRTRTSRLCGSRSLADNPTHSLQRGATAPLRGLGLRPQVTKRFWHSQVCASSGAYAFHPLPFFRARLSLEGARRGRGVNHCRAHGTLVTLDVADSYAIKNSSMTEAKFGHCKLFRCGDRSTSDRLTETESNFVSHPLIPWKRAKLPTLAESLASYFCCKPPRQQTSGASIRNLPDFYLAEGSATRG